MEQSYDTWIDRTAIDRDGDKLGKITAIFYDDVTGRPEWVKVRTGAFGKSRLVPIAGAQMMRHTDNPDEFELMLNYSADMIKAAPDVDDDIEDSTADLEDDREHLSAVSERELYHHYGFTHENATSTGTYGKDYGKLRPDVNYPAARFNRERSAWDAPGTEQGGEVVSEATAHSEQVQKVQTGETVRLRKYQHTEMVPVTKEEIRVEKVGDTTQAKRR